MNRTAYIVSFVRALCVHRSWSSAKWVTSFEGKNWK
jgi:hypothetical protein